MLTFWSFKICLNFPFVLRRHLDSVMRSNCEMGHVPNHIPSKCVYLEPGSTADTRRGARYPVCFSSCLFSVRPRDLKVRVAGLVSDLSRSR